MSASEISHDQSEKNILCKTPPSREFASSLRFLAKTNKKVRHIERQRNIPPNHRPTRCHCEARSAAAIRWNNGRSICRVLFQGDRHANARDDTEIQPSLRKNKNGGASLIFQTCPAAAFVLFYSLFSLRSAFNFSRYFLASVSALVSASSIFFFSIVILFTTSVLFFSSSARSSSVRSLFILLR